MAEEKNPKEINLSDLEKDIEEFLNQPYEEIDKLIEAEREKDKSFDNPEVYMKWYNKLENGKIKSTLSRLIHSAKYLEDIAIYINDVEENLSDNKNAIHIAKDLNNDNLIAYLYFIKILHERYKNMRSKGINPKNFLEGINYADREIISELAKYAKEKESNIINPTFH